MRQMQPVNPFGDSEREVIERRPPPLRTETIGPPCYDRASLIFVFGRHLTSATCKKKKKREAKPLLNNLCNPCERKARQSVRELSSVSGFSFAIWVCRTKAMAAR